MTQSRIQKFPAWMILIAILISGNSLRAEPETPKPAKGHIIAIGGALKADNKVIYQRIIQRAGADGIILVVPTASADSAAAIDSATKALQPYCTNQKVLPLEVTTKSAELANADSVVASIDKASALFFTGGDQNRIVSVFRPVNPKTGQPETTRARDAMFRLLERGGCIAGTSAGAAMMSEIMFKGGSAEPTYDWYRGLSEANRSAVRQKFKSTGLFQNTGVDEKGVTSIGSGMGFLRDVMVDTHFIPRNRIARLWPALEIAGQDVGIGVSEDSAVDVDLADGRVEALSRNGKPAAVLVVREEAWRVTIMQSGNLAPKWRSKDVTFSVPLGSGQEISPKVKEILSKK